MLIKKAEVKLLLWCAFKDLNPGPPSKELGALSSELKAQISYDIILYHSTFFVNTIFLFLNK
mgnify:CR=1 FL=1